MIFEPGFWIFIVVVGIAINFFPKLLRPYGPKGATGAEKRSDSLNLFGLANSSDILFWWSQIIYLVVMERHIYARYNNNGQYTDKKIPIDQIVQIEVRKNFSKKIRGYCWASMVLYLSNGSQSTLQMPVNDCEECKNAIEEAQARLRGGHNG